MPPLVSEGGGLVCESVGKADLLSDHFDSKQSREAVDLRSLVIHLLLVLPPLRLGRVRLGRVRLGRVALLYKSIS